MCFPVKKQNKPLHSQKRLGGLKPPLEQVQGDSKLHNPSGWETLASTRLTQGGTKSGRREGTPSSRQPKLRNSLPLSDEDLREREREREREERGELVTGILVYALLFILFAP